MPNACSFSSVSWRGGRGECWGSFTGLRYAQGRPGRVLEGPTEQNRGHCWRQSQAPILRESSKPGPAEPGLHLCLCGRQEPSIRSEVFEE